MESSKRASIPATSIPSSIEHFWINNGKNNFGTLNIKKNRVLLVDYKNTIIIYYHYCSIDGISRYNY